VGFTGQPDTSFCTSVVLGRSEMKISSVHLSLLMWASLFGCGLPRDSDMEASNQRGAASSGDSAQESRKLDSIPAANKPVVKVTGECPIELRVGREGALLTAQILADRCFGSQDQFLSSVEREVTNAIASSDWSAVSSISITGPLTSDNLMQLGLAWSTICNRQAKVDAAAFAKAYREMPTPKKLIEIMARHGLHLQVVSVENFYPVGSQMQHPIAVPSCKLGLLAPVVWFAK
jgi:hypothetical protein